jgi:hypothetical protein
MSLMSAVRGVTVQPLLRHRARDQSLLRPRLDVLRLREGGDARRGAGTHTSAMGTTAPALDLASVARGEAVVETGVTYDGNTSVLVRVSKRDGRYKVTDDGRAVSAAGVSGRRLAYPNRIDLDPYSANVSRQGVVWLPAATPSDEWLTTICTLVARGSVALYERLLELEESA